MRNSMKKLISFVLLSATAFSTVACKGDDNSDKATLHIYSFTSGFGDEWLTSLIADYEERMKDVEIDGKKGIHIEPTAIGQDVHGSDMASRDEVIYFLEQQNYYELLAGNYIADISDAITQPNPYDEGGKTLESKMFADQKSYLSRQVNGKTAYYAYPHYFTSFGIVYDVELFDTKGYYLVEGYEGYDAATQLDYMFVGNTTGSTKTAGPDGQKGTPDDGLPTTYDEFFLLCDYINSKSDNPLIWSGQHRRAYLTHFINALATDYEGYEQMRLNFTFDGTATNLGKEEGGQFVKDAEGTVIDGTNGYEMARQAGKYYAMDFYSNLLNKSYINDKKATLYSSTFSHQDAQAEFLKNPNLTNKNAMLLDGSWWEMEATTWFDGMAEINSAYSKQNKKYGWMPLPKQSADKVGEKSTMFDIMYPLCVMKNGVDTSSWQYKYAIDFIQFANSDAQLAKFTQITGCTKALNYSLTPDQYNLLTPYAKTFYNAYKASDIVFPYAQNALFANNQNTFKEIDGDGTGSPLYKSNADSISKPFVASIESGAVTAGSYFNGMYGYFKDELSSIWKSVK